MSDPLDVEVTDDLGGTHNCEAGIEIDHDSRVLDLVVWRDDVEMVRIMFNPIDAARIADRFMGGARALSLRSAGSSEEA